MRLVPFLTATILAVIVAVPAGAQRERDDRRDRQREPETRIYRTPGPGMFGMFDGPRAVLGITTGGSGGARDTLGVLITSITPNGPAERAGLEEGNRIQAINNVNLRLSPADADDREMSHLMTRRLTRELNRLKPGDEVELRVYGGGRTRAVRVRTADADSLYRRQRRARVDSDDRATLGLSLGSTGSVRDTLGVLVVGVNDSGPAARAGIIEGNRIAEINGVNLRTSREDIGDEWVANTRVQRLMREIRRLEPGNEVTLRVWQDGQFRTVRVRAVRASDLPRRRGGFFMSGDHIGIMHPMPPMPPIDFERIGPEVRSYLERALDGAGRAIEGVGRGIGRTLMDLDDLEDDSEVR
ncbi:MAG: PDZ domain-containing protein [Gemmatimonadota bacterium]|nr:PDZ domain-containing protein [Gemmatimonadota bacterium]